MVSLSPSWLGRLSFAFLVWTSPSSLFVRQKEKKKKTRKKKEEKEKRKNERKKKNEKKKKKKKRTKTNRKRNKTEKNKGKKEEKRKLLLKVADSASYKRAQTQKDHGTQLPPLPILPLPWFLIWASLCRKPTDTLACHVTFLEVRSLGACRLHLGGAAAAHHQSLFRWVTRLRFLVVPRPALLPRRRKEDVPVIVCAVPALLCSVVACAACAKKSCKFSGADVVNGQVHICFVSCRASSRSVVLNVREPGRTITYALVVWAKRRNLFWARSMHGMCLWGDSFQRVCPVRCVSGRFGADVTLGSLSARSWKVTFSVWCLFSFWTQIPTPTRTFSAFQQKVPGRKDKITTSNHPCRVALPECNGRLDNPVTISLTLFCVNSALSGGMNIPVQHTFLSCSFLLNFLWPFQKRNQCWVKFCFWMSS